MRFRVGLTFFVTQRREAEERERIAPGEQRDLPSPDQKRHGPAAPGEIALNVCNYLTRKMIRSEHPLPESPCRGVVKSGPRKKQPGEAEKRCGGACVKRR